MTAFLSAFYALIGALPEVLKLIQILQDAAREEQVQRRLRDDIKTIHQAFSSGDASGLNRLFQSQTPPSGGVDNGPKK